MHYRHSYFLVLGTTGKGIVQPEKLPPTERAGYFHGLRAHHQIMNWSLLEDEFNISPVEWCWKKEHNLLVPIMTHIEIASDGLAKVIRCKCKSSAKNPCGTKICTCRKYGLPCVSACGDRRGTECNNIEVCFPQFCIPNIYKVCSKKSWNCRTYNHLRNKCVVFSSFISGGTFWWIGLRWHRGWRRGRRRGRGRWRWQHLSYIYLVTILLPCT